MLSFSAAAPTESIGGSAPGMARSALSEPFREPEAALGAAEPLHSRDQVLATALARAGCHPCTLGIARRAAYWTLVQYVGVRYARPAVVLAVLAALAAPAPAAEPWVLWEKKERQTAGELDGAWIPVGSYEGARGCRATRREIGAPPR